MSNSVLPGFFGIGPDDELQVVDIYAIKDSIADSVDPDNEISGAIQSVGQNQIVKSVAEIIDTVIRMGVTQGGQGCIKPINNQRISNEIAGGNLNTSDLCGNTATALVDAIASFDLREIDSIRDVAGNAISVVRGIEATEASRIVDLATNFTQTAAIGKVKDVAASMGIRNTLITESVKLGLFDLLDSLFEEEEEVDKDAAMDLVGTAVSNGDIKTVVKLVRLLGRDQVLQKYPELIQDVLSQYRFPMRTTTREYPELLTSLKADLLEINPRWRLESRSGEDISSLRNMRYPSEHAKILFMLDPELRIEVLVAEHYRPNDLINIAKKVFPTAAL